MSAVETELVTPPDNPEVRSAEPPQLPVFQKLHDLSESQRDDLLEETRLRYKDSREFMDRMLTRMRKNYMAYRSIAEPLRDRLNRPIKNRANLYIPYPFAIVESEIPRTAGRLPRIHAFPRNPQKKDKVQVIQNNVDDTFDRAGYLGNQILWARQAAIYGWSPIFIYWRKEMKPVFERTMIGGGEETIEKVEKTVKDHFDFMVLDVWDSFMQSGVEEPETGDYFHFRQWMSVKDIQRREDWGIFYPGTAQKVKDLGDMKGEYTSDRRKDRDD